MLLLALTVVACAAGTDRAPRGRVLDVFAAFLPRPPGQIGNSKWVGDVTTAQTEAASKFDGRDPAQVGPLRATAEQEGLTNEGRNGSYLLRFDGALCPDSLVVPRSNPAEALTVEAKTRSGWARVEGDTLWRTVVGLLLAVIVGLSCKNRNTNL